MTDFEKNLMFKRNEKLIYLILKRYNLIALQDDLYDVGLIGLTKGINSFDDSKGCKESSYLYPCIFNEIKRYVDSINAKKRKSEKKVISIEENIADDMLLKDIIFDDTVDIESTVINNEIIEITKNAIDSLKPRYKEIVTKYFFENKTLEEIACEKRVTKEAIRQSRDRALKSLRKILEKFDL